MWLSLGLLMYAALALLIDSEIMLDNVEKPNIIEILYQLFLYINILDWDNFTAL